MTAGDRSPVSERTGGDGAVQHRRRSHPDTPAARESCPICRAETMIRRGLERARDERRAVAERYEAEREAEREQDRRRASRRP